MEQSETESDDVYTPINANEFQCCFRDEYHYKPLAHDENVTTTKPQFSLTTRIIVLTSFFIVGFIIAFILPHNISFARLLHLRDPLYIVTKPQSSCPKRYAVITTLLTCTEAAGYLRLQFKSGAATRRILDALELKAPVCTRTVHPKGHLRFEQTLDKSDSLVCISVSALNVSSYLDDHVSDNETSGKEESVSPAKKTYENLFRRQPEENLTFPGGERQMIFDISQPDLFDAMMANHPEHCFLPENEQNGPPRWVWMHRKGYDFLKVQPGGETHESEDHYLKQNSSTTAFRLHKIRINITELRRPIFQWYANKEYCNGYKKKSRTFCIDDISYFKDEFCVDLTDPNMTLTGEQLWKEISEVEAHKWWKEIDDSGHYELEVVTAKQAYAHEDSYWACGEQMFEMEGCGWYKRYDKLKLKRHPRPKGEHYEKVIITHQSFGYWHWVAENLPRMIFYRDHLRNNPDVRYTWSTSRGFKRAWLDMLGFPLNQTLKARFKDISVDALYVAQATPCVLGRRWQLAKLNLEARRGVARAFGTALLSLKDRHILITKRSGKTPRRKVYNWDEMHDAIVKNFPDEVVQVFDDKNSSLANYAPMYANAWIIISVFGAGEANQVLSAPGTVLVEIAPPGRGNLNIMSSLSLGQRFFGYVAKNIIRSGKYSKEGAFVVDPKEICNIVRWYRDSVR